MPLNEPRACPNPEGYKKYILFLFAAALLRLGGFFLLEIDWDEDSFILMGQDILNGHLPYAHLWVMKPPAVFLETAGFIAVFGKSLAAVRFGAALSVALAAWFLDKAVARTYGAAAGTASGLLLVLSASVFPTGLAFMSETAALWPLCAFLWAAGGGRPFLAGIFLGIAVLTKTNLAYLLPLGIAIYAAADRRVENIAGFLLGFALLPVALAIVYAAAGRFELLFTTMVRAPMLYTAMPLPERFDNTFVSLAALLKSKISVFWIIALCGAPVLLKKPNRAAGAMLCGFFALVFLSILHAGKGYQHYFIMLIPFLAASGGVFAASLFRRGRLWRAALAVSGAALALPNLAGSARAALLVPVKGLSAYDSRYELIDRAKSFGARGRYAYFAAFPVGYWLTGTEIPTRYLHPGDIAQERIMRLLDGPGADSIGELEAIFGKNPAFVVSKKYLLNFTPDMVGLFNARMARDFTPDRQYECGVWNTETTGKENSLKTMAYVFREKR